MSTKKVLIIEDDPDVLATLVEILTLEDFSIDSADNGADGAAFLDVSSYDLIIVDWGLPDTTGIELLKKFRTKGVETPVLMLTARNQIEDKEEGLYSGADDYLTKPFSVRELRARVTALMRRSGSYVDAVLQFRNLTMNVKTREVTVDGHSVTLLPKEFALLETLLRNKNKVYTLDDLVSKLWDSSDNASYDAVRQTMRRLRKKIDVDENNSLITTIVGVGYKIEEQ